MRRPPTAEDLLGRISGYVEDIESRAYRSADYLVEKVQAIREARLDEVDGAISEACHAIESERDGVIGALPCAEGLAAFAEEVGGAAVDMPTEAARLLHEVDGRLMVEDPATVLAWLRSALAGVARVDEAAEVSLAVDDAIGSSFAYAPDFAPAIAPAAFAPLPVAELRAAS